MFSNRRRRIAIICAGLLLTAVVIAMGMMSLAITNARRYTVVVHNSSQERLDGVRVLGGGCDASYGSLLPGATARRSFWIVQDGTLVFRASSGGVAIEQMIDGYVTTNLGGHRRVTVSGGETVSVTSAANRLTLLDRVLDLVFWRGRSPCKGEPIPEPTAR
jgi:hypothetical protein